MDPKVVLAADLAVSNGQASAEEAAAAIREGRVLGDRAEGDALQTIVRRGGIDRAIHRVIGPELSRALSDLGAGPRAPLRTLDPDRYLDFSVLGKGAMGVVFRALDTELKRDVAFKVIRSGDEADEQDPLSLTPPPEEEGFKELRARFLQEAWVTGGLEHPGIVPVYGLGQTGSGMPFYAMRIVPGKRTLLGAIDGAKDIDARLGLLEPFLKACDAVAYAHSRGVIHRDLKPDNIALGDFGEVFVLDWGLAKLKDRPDLAEKRWHDRIQRFRQETNLETLVSALGTPGYMSPEAALVKTEQVDEKSDVYSLGAILYQILTGKLPFEFESYPDMLNKILKEAPPEPTAIDPAVPVEPGRVCLKALAREPEERFARVDEIAAAIRAWQTESAIDREVAALLERAKAALAAEQIDRAAVTCARILELKPGLAAARELQTECEAHRERVIAQRERAARGKLLRRVGVVGLLTATAATVVVAFLLNARRREAEDARTRAEAERTRAEDLSSFMLFDLKVGLQEIGRLDLLGKVALKAKEYYDGLPAADLEGDTLHRRFAAFVNVGEVLLDEGSLPDALDSFEQAHAIAEQLTKADPAELSWQRDLASAKSRIGSVLWKQGRSDGALARYRDTAALLRGLAPAHEADRDLHVALAKSERDIADALQRTGKIQEACKHYDDALAALVRFRADPDVADARARVLVSRGDALAELGDTKGALASHRESLEIRRDRHRKDRDNADLQVGLATSLERFGDRMLAAGNLDGALEHFQEFLVLQRALTVRDPSNTEWQVRLSIALTKTGHVLTWKRDLAGALTHRRESLEACRRLVELDPTNVTWRYKLAGALAHLGMNHRMRNDIEGALVQYREALAILEALVAQSPANTEYLASQVSTLLSTGHCYQAAGDFKNALVYFEQCTKRGRSLVNAAPANQRYAQELGWSLIDAGTARERTGDADGALKDYRDAEQLARPIVDGGKANVEWRRILAYSRAYPGRVLAAQGRWKEAEAAAKEGLEVHTRLLKDAAYLARDHAEFERIHKGIALRSGTRKPETPEDHHTLGYEYFKNGEYVRAAEHFREALKDPAVRNDLQRSHLYNGACAAARASTVTKGDAALAWKRQAIEYLKGALALWRQQIKDRDRLAALVEKARAGDADLAPLRDMPEFEALFD